MDCIFCKIINNEIPSYKIYEDERVLAFLDVSPKSNGHTLVIPKKHFKDLYDIDEDYLNHILKISKKIGNILKEKLNCDGITLMQNNGLGQEVKHFHLHIIPKYKNETKEEIQNIYKKITN